MSNFTFLVFLFLLCFCAPSVLSNLKNIILYRSEDMVKKQEILEDIKDNVEGQIKIAVKATTPRQIESFNTEDTRVHDRTLACQTGWQVDTWLRHPANCSRYFVCSGGQVREMKPCIQGWVFSIKNKECVPVKSALDDCAEMIFSFPTNHRAPSTLQDGSDQVRATGQRLLWHPHFSQEEDATPRLQLQATRIVSSKVDNLPQIDGMCNLLHKGVFPHPHSCARYFNCSLRPDAVMETFYGGWVMECPYPQLFSSHTLQCEDFEHVSCGGRQVPKSPCDYRANHCHETSHCIPCWVRYASCLHMEDGLNPWPDLEWRPFFVECYRQRTVFQGGSCGKSAVFSPLTKACETPYSIPREHGGWRPSCQGRKDGKYPDEYGRCESYYVCRGQIFTGFFSCSQLTLFDPITGTCQGRSRVAYPCGDGDMPNTCLGKSDGWYADPHGRCTHYLSCLGGEVDGVYMCPQGVFNPTTRSCHTSSADVASPCGSFPNPCLKKKDGYHSDDDERSCSRYHLCEGSMLSATFTCQNDQVYSHVTESCVDVTETALPCGLAPSCDRKADGRYPALNKGVQFYYLCQNSSFAGYSRCSLQQGGLAFSALTQRCSSPTTVCEEITGSRFLC